MKFYSTVGKLLGKRLLGTTRRRWEHNIKMGFREMASGWNWRALVSTAGVTRYDNNYGNKTISTEQTPSLEADSRSTKPGNSMTFIEPECS
jgi:hypothetical protein